MSDSRLLEPADVPSHLREATTHVLKPRFPARPPVSGNQPSHRFAPYKPRHAAEEPVEAVLLESAAEHSQVIDRTELGMPSPGESTARLQLPEAPTGVLVSRSPGAALAAPAPKPASRLSEARKVLGEALRSLRRAL